MLRLVTQWFNPPNLSHCDLLLRLLYFVEVDIERLIGNPMKDQTPRGVLESNMLVQPLFAFSDMVNAIDKKRSEFDAVLLRAREYADLLAALSVTQLSLLLTVGMFKYVQFHRLHCH